MHKNIFILVLSVLVLSIVLAGCAKSKPTIALSDVKDVTAASPIADKAVKTLTPSHDKAAIEEILSMYNRAVPVASQEGTTPDITIRIRLKNGGMVSIWTLYTQEKVTIGIKRPNGKYFQTNVRSEELATYLERARLKAGFEPSYRHPEGF